MATLQVHLTLWAFGEGDAVLGELKVSVPIEAPLVPYGNLQREAGRMRDALRELWESHYGANPALAPPTSRWALVIKATMGDLQYEATKNETLPLDFTVLVFSVLHQGLIDAAAGITGG